MKIQFVKQAHMYMHVDLMGLEQEFLINAYAMFQIINVPPHSFSFLQSHQN